MFNPDSENIEYGAPEAPNGFTGTTDRVTGEYRYKNGYTQKLYTDANYIPADRNTNPARYYVPSHKAAEDRPGTSASRASAIPPKEKKKQRGGTGKIITVACLCLLFSVIGGVIGAWFTNLRLSSGEADLGQYVKGFAAGDMLNQSTYTERSGMLPVSETASTTAELLLPVETPAVPVAAVTPAPAYFEPSDIYERACSQVVGVTTEVTYSNFFGQTSSSAVSGTGFVITTDGNILTNYHVIEYAYQYGYSVSVILYDGTAVSAEIVGVDPDNDLAVLKIDPAGLEPAVLGNSDEIRVGEAAYAVGNPLGELEFTMTSGTVSALDRMITSDNTGAPVNMFQIDAAVNSGNSGGPVYNARGEVIGVVTAKLKSSGVEGIGFAIPINDAERIAGDLIQNGYVTGRAYLGVSFDDSSTSVYNYYYHDLWNLPQGVLVLAVEKGSCAEKAGIRSYDTITSVGGAAITSGAELSNAIRGFSAGSKTEITVYRAGDRYSEGKMLTFTVVFDEAVPSRGGSGMSGA